MSLYGNITAPQKQAIQNHRRYLTSDQAGCAHTHDYQGGLKRFLHVTTVFATRKFRSWMLFPFRKVWLKWRGRIRVYLHCQTVLENSHLWWGTREIKSRSQKTHDASSINSAPSLAILSLSICTKHIRHLLLCHCMWLRFFMFHGYVWPPYPVCEFLQVRGPWV